MATSYTCDGCNEVLEKPVKLGFVIVREYCHECTVGVGEYLDARDKLHDELSGQWEKKHDALQKAWHKKNKGKLPDEADA